MLKQKWKYVLGGLFLCVLLGFGAIWYFLARSSSLNVGAQLRLLSLTNTVSGPIATLEIVDPWYLRKTTVTRSVTHCMIDVYRHREWSRLEWAQDTVKVTPLLLRGRMATLGGTTLEVKVPVCEKWRITCYHGDGRKFKWKVIPFQFGTSNRCVSAEIPGWSEIRKGFRTLEK